MAEIASPWADRAIVDDPYPFYAALREQAPVWRVPRTGTRFVASWELVEEAVGRPDDFSSNLTAVLVTGTDGGPAEFDMTPLGAAINVLATGDEPEHTPQRKLVAPHFTAGRLHALEHDLHAVMDALWSACLAHPGGRLDWMAAVGDRLPMTLVAGVIGLPTDDVARLISWGYDGTDLLGGLVSLAEMGRLAESAAALSEYLLARVEAACASPQGDLLGAYAARVDAGDMTVEDVVGALVILIGAGGESTAGLIGNATRFLAERPELQAELRRDPSLIARFLEEVLRLESPFRGHYRHIRHDTELGGEALAAGDHLLLLWAAANRDPKEFEAPDDLRLDRRLSTHHLAFGRGLHFCLGAPLARLEAHCAVEALLTRTTSFGLDPDASPVWQPSLFVRRHAELWLEIEPV
ncbi:MAG TPA: cytochrome P450 [Acidimicrobiia bacterium]